MFSLRRSVFRSLKPGTLYVPPAILQQQRVKAVRAVSSLSQNPSILSQSVPHFQPTTAVRYQSGWSNQDQSQAGNENPVPASHTSATGEPLEPSKSIYVGNISYGIRAEDLEREFKDFGNVISSKIIYDPRGLSKGFGYVEFEELNSAVEAVQKMHGLVVDGRRVTVQFVAKRDPSTSRTNNEPSRTLFIGNLAFDITDKDLNDLFKDVKNCTDVRVAIDRRTGQPRGFAHADFIDTQSAVSAREILENKELFGRKLKLDFSSNSRSGSGRSFMK